MTMINEARVLRTIDPLNKLLETRFGLRIEIGPVEHLTEVRAHYNDKRRRFLETMGAAHATRCPGYAKSILIVETINIILREIAPKRMKRRVKAKS